MSTYTYKLLPWVALAMLWVSPALPADLEAELKAIDSKVIAWRRDFHQNPELSNREVRTSGIVAEHLKRLGLEVETGIARTGVVALLKTGKPGPTIAIRADMDALPVVERTDVPFKSVAKSSYRGEEVGVMHACGHDSHTAILMGLAEVLVKSKGRLRGNVLFIFQPAEEGAPPGEVGGASEMLKAGIFEKYKPEVAFGLHVWASLNTGQIGYRSGPFMADSQGWRVVVNGRQTHGSRPWQGVDPIVVSAQIVNAMQTIVSRQVDITQNPAVVSVGIIKGGVRNNIIPDTVEMIGTIRTFDPKQKQQILDSMKRLVENTAQANGATATVDFESYYNPVTYNDPKLTERVLPSLRRVAGAGNVNEIALITGAEDFAYYGQKIPAFFFMVGVTPKGTDVLTAPANHSPLFYLDETALPLATRAMAAVATDYLMK
ncbi:MAG TPA: amidohydrolase [Steroidobacteraceae bacterium]|jgi:amidohydrolase|nr:amidohydrolase [Steroidobacteraceae bacterium]